MRSEALRKGWVGGGGGVGRASGRICAGGGVGRIGGRSCALARMEVMIMAVAQSDIEIFDGMD